MALLIGVGEGCRTVRAEPVRGHGTRWRRRREWRVDQPLRTMRNSPMTTAAAMSPSRSQLIGVAGGSGTGSVTRRGYRAPRFSRSR